MADKHSTPDNSESGTERKLIMRYRPQMGAPQSGDLRQMDAQAGFNIGHNVAAKVMAGCIVLVADSPKEQGLTEELRDVNKPLEEIQASLSAVQSA